MPLLQRQREALRVNAVSTHGVDAVALEATLAGFNSRSVNPERYLAYLTALHSVRWATRALYTDMVWRQLRFDALRGRQRAGQRMVAKFKAKHGDPEKAVLVVGDWGARASGSASARRLHMKHHTPSMGVGTLRLFRRAGYQVGGLLPCVCLCLCACALGCDDHRCHCAPMCRSTLPRKHTHRNAVTVANPEIAHRFEWHGIHGQVGWESGARCGAWSAATAVPGCSSGTSTPR
jgi:hypothetical protein